MTIIEVTRNCGQDAIMAAKEAAQQNDTQLSGNLRWYGAYRPYHGEVNTKDGRVIRVNEPDEDAIQRYEEQMIDLNKTVNESAKTTGKMQGSYSLPQNHPRKA